jgi:hypothetical protein
MDGVREYLARYVYGPASHEEYVQLFQPERIERQRQAARELVSVEFRGA